MLDLDDVGFHDAGLSQRLIEMLLNSELVLSAVVIPPQAVLWQNQSII